MDKRGLPRPRLRYTFGLWLCLSLVLELLFYAFSRYHYTQLNQQMLEEIKLRVSIDLASNEVAGEIHALNVESLDNYIALLNKYIKTQGWPLAVNNIRFKAHALPQSKNTLFLPSGAYLQYQNPGVSWHQHLSLLPIAAALLLSLFSGFYKTGSRAQQAKKKPMLPESHNERQPQARNGAAKVLNIDLHSRSLRHIQSDNRAEMANKPLCFYLALIEYCSDRPGVFLSPAKNLPPELLQLCETYFRRMTELGHAIRKRPDFNKNLEKTLSEIRAALDQVFVDDQDQKILFYPRKAIGEGSRSKVHNYAPPQLNKEQIDINGL
ncbi:MAG: hypothetical protein KTR17_09100 [Cellvibrionaceae bacterium]|nr:hypothetical protein [Cellvibrionaceae bacterium]